MCRSTRLQGNLNQVPSTDRLFWENVPNPVDIEREQSQGHAEAVAAMQHITNNICAFEENTRPVSRDVEQHIIPELNEVIPIPDATVNSGPEAEAFPQELTNYTEEISSQRIPPMVYLDAENNRSNQRGKVWNGENEGTCEAHLILKEGTNKILNKVLCPEDTQNCPRK